MAKTAPTRTVRYGDGFLTPRGPAKVQARWKDGTKTRGKTFDADTLEAAWDLAEDHLRKISRDKRDGRYTSPSDLTVAQILGEYRERGASRWSANTQATYKLLATKHIVPYIGKRKIVDVTPRVLQLWIDDLGKTGLSPAVIENAKIVVSGACREAVQMGVIPTNPAIGLRLPARKKSQMPTWTADEVRAVIAACGNDLWMRTYYTVALTTGMRPGELRALMWKDVDIEQARLHCRRSMTRDASFRAMVGDQTKSGRTRVIALPMETIAILQEMRKDQVRRQVAHANWQKADLIFDRGDGRFMALTTLERRHQLTIETAKVTRIRLHDLRHTAATLLLEADVHPKIVSDILGHSSIAITMDRYVHVSTDLQRTATEKLGNVLSAGSKRSEPA